MFKLLLAITMMAGKTDTLAPLRITNLSSGDKGSLVVYIGLPNKFLVEDSAITGIVPQDQVRFMEDRTLVITPFTTGNLTVTFLRGEERVDLDLRAKMLGLVMPQPRSAINDTIMVDSLEKDPGMDFMSPDREELFKGFRVSAFTATLNNRSFPCKDSFSAELMQACREAQPGETLKVTDLVISNPDATITRKIRCNQAFTIAASPADPLASK